jgi:hypothetical protein
MNKQKKSDQTALLLNFGQGNFRGVAKQCFYYLTEAGQIGPKPNRPKVKSAPSQIGTSQICPSQIGPKSNRPHFCCLLLSTCKVK